MESGVQCVMTGFFRQKQILFVDNLGLLATSTMELLVLVFLGMCMYRALQVTRHMLVGWLSSCGECHHGNASLNQIRATPNVIKTLHNLVRCPQLQTRALPIPYFL